jgi:hypothetical protein
MTDRNWKESHFALDHGYEVDENKRCRATTKKERQCALPALRGIDLCALHSGLARPNGAIGYGSLQALEAYKRALGAGGQRLRTTAR